MSSTRISKNLIYLIAILLAFFILLILVWLWYDISMKRLDNEAQRLKQSGLFYTPADVTNILPKNISI